MHATAEIDKAGRIVVPKKMRDALHLMPGTRIVLDQQGDRIVLEPETNPRGLFLKGGTLVYDAGLLPALDAVDWVEKDRESRMTELLKRHTGK